MSKIIDIIIYVVIQMKFTLERVRVGSLFQSMFPNPFMVGYRKGYTEPVFHSIFQFLNFSIEFECIHTGMVILCEKRENKLKKR